MSRMDALSGRRGDMNSSGRHGTKVNKAWRDRKTLESERLPRLRGEETRVRGSIQKSSEEE